MPPLVAALAPDTAIPPTAVALVANPPVVDAPPANNDNTYCGNEV